MYPTFWLGSSTPSRFIWTRVTRRSTFPLHITRVLFTFSIPSPDVAFVASFLIFTVSYKVSKSNTSKCINLLVQTIWHLTCFENTECKLNSDIYLQWALLALLADDARNANLSLLVNVMANRKCCSIDPNSVNLRFGLPFCLPPLFPTKIWRDRNWMWNWSNKKTSYGGLLNYLLIINVMYYLHITDLTIYTKYTYIERMYITQCTCTDDALSISSRRYMLIEEYAGNGRQHIQDTLTFLDDLDINLQTLWISVSAQVRKWFWGKKIASWLPVGCHVDGTTHSRTITGSYLSKNAVYLAFPPSTSAWCDLVVGRGNPASIGQLMSCVKHQRQIILVMLFLYIHKCLIN
jgi:hypothetical protein